MQKDQFDVLNRQYADLQIEAAKVREQLDLLKQYVGEEAFGVLPLIRGGPDAEQSQDPVDARPV